MTQHHTALQVDVAEDLLPLSALLHQRGIAHRVFEEHGRQVLVVQTAEHVAEVQALYEAWRGGELQITLRRRAMQPAGSWLDAAGLRGYPVTMLLLLLSVAGFAVVYLRPLNPVIDLLTFLPFSNAPTDSIIESMQGQYWRWVTPAFLHFGWLHIVFNSLWLWELGRKVEQVMGPFNMAMLFVVIALVSNTAQFLFSGSSAFGGMSGVVYGLLGFTWIAPLLQPRWRIQPLPAIMWFMVGYLVLGFAGVIEGVGLGRIANVAHLAGLLAGLVLGAVFGLVSRLGGDTREPPPV
jgi:GlpG protein